MTEVTPTALRDQQPVLDAVTDFVVSSAATGWHGGEAAHAAVARAFLDTVAVTQAAATDPIAETVHLHAEATYAPGVATSWADGAQYCAEGAAFVNGTLGHLLDYDDVTPPMRGHPSIALLPALVAVAETHDATCAQLSSAYAVGFEVLCKLARAGVQAQYAAGWHSTAVLGVVAATAGVAALRRLDTASTGAALACAAGQASGTRENFGTPGKALQVGFAAAAAVRAAGLAQLGASASRTALDGPSGFLNLTAMRAGPWHMEPLGANEGELVNTGIGVKLYPSCYSTHAPLSALQQMRRDPRVTADNIARVEVTVHRTGTLPLISGVPRDGLSAKFSMEYLIASALLDGDVTLHSFRTSQVRRRQVRDLMKRVHVAEDDGPPLPRRGRVELEFLDGTVLAAQTSRIPGSPDLPVHAEDLQAKVEDCRRHARTGSGGDMFASAPDVSTLIRSWASLQVRDVVSQAVCAKTERTSSAQHALTGER